MPTLSAMFRLLDGYSSQVAKIVSGTDKATEKMLGASKAADKVNDSTVKAGKGFRIASGQVKEFGTELDGMNRKATKTNSGLRALIGTVVSMAALKKGAGVTDSYINASARLNMVNDGSQTPEELQDKVFAAAGRSRGGYTDMASAVSKMNLLAGDSFSSNDEAIGFTELLQKSLKVSGAGTSEQQSAFLQLTQAMAAGKLQGDEFRSVMENAPMVADAIARYMGKSKGELKEMSSQGLITADIIKNAMFGAAGDINEKFSEMPMTFADAGTLIKNVGMDAFGGVFEKMNAMLNSDMGQAAIMNLTGLVYMAAAGFDTLLDGVGWVADHLDVLAPIVLGLAGAWLVYNATAGIAWLTTLKNAAAMGLKATADWAEYAAIFMLIWAQEGFNAALAACPITWIIGAIILLVAAFYAGVAAVNHFAGTTVSATGLIGGAVGILVAGVLNKLFLIWNGFADLANFVGNVFNNPAAAVQVLFYDMAITVLGYIETMAAGIEKIINSIPGVTVDITNGLGNLKDRLEKDVAVIKDESGWKEYVKKKEYIDYSDAAAKGYDIGRNVENKVSGLFSGFAPGDMGGDMDFGQFATAGNPATVKGTGKGGAVKVENEEDVEWMRRLAERDFVARIAQNTLAPNIRVEFTGPITKEADVNRVAAHLGELLKEQIATAPEGVYA